jgi:hypothetical protein
MQKLKALFLLLLFCGYTLGSFATVHQCGNEITDIDILSIADCEHESKEVSNNCESHCCHEKDSDDVEDKDCCSTSKLSSYSVDTILQSSEKLQKNDLIQLQVNKECFSAYTNISPPSHGDYKSPKIRRDIPIEVQCFLI